jgi:GH25 family lysozyme M1 (1,4-beta-N-acetylmuramidase)
VDVDRHELRHVLRDRAGLMALTFADVSSHNTVPNWPALLGSVDACVVKATQGSSYVWSGAPAALASIRAAGKLTGAYAFAGDLGSDGLTRCGDPNAEADFFLAHYDWRPGEIPVNDFEPSVMPADPDGWCAAFAARVQSRIGVVPWTYMSSSVARSNTWAKTRAMGSPLWVAQYGANNGQPGTPPTVGSWPGYVAWQFTSNGTRPGVAGVIDLSTFYGDAAAWKAYGTPGGTDMPLTQDDIAAIWAFSIGGVHARDRLQGIDSIQLPALATAVAKIPATAPVTVDAVALAAALLADPAGVDRLGAAIAAHLKLTSG